MKKKNDKKKVREREKVREVVENIKGLTTRVV